MEVRFSPAGFLTVLSQILKGFSPEFCEAALNSVQ